MRPLNRRERIGELRKINRLYIHHDIDYKEWSQRRSKLIRPFHID